MNKSSTFKKKLFLLVNVNFPHVLAWGSRDISILWKNNFEKVFETSKKMVKGFTEGF